MSGIDEVIQKILERRSTILKNRGLLVGVSGIDGCGKGYLAKQIQAHLGWRSVASALINADSWLNLPNKRFAASTPAEHFYENAIRFDELFADLVLPLRDEQSIYLVADSVEETATQYSKQIYDFKHVGVTVVEGIFLFKRQYRRFFDLAIWIDCSFPTALARAIERAQEGLSPAKTIAAYETIYFPAQRIHLAQDNPREIADVIFENDYYAVRQFSSNSRQNAYRPHITLH